MMQPTPLLYPVAFSHLTSHQNYALSRLQLSKILLQKGCPVQCTGCGATAKMLDASKMMQFERYRALIAGIKHVSQTFERQLVSNPFSLFGPNEPLYYRSIDARGNFVNFYHAAEELYMVMGIQTYLTTSGWPNGDNFMHGAMRMVMANLDKKRSPISTVGYSFKTMQKQTRFGLNRFIDRCLGFLFTATDDEITSKYAADSKLAFNARAKFKAKWLNDPEALKDNLRKLKDPAHPIPQSMSHAWIFKPFLTELPKEHFYARMAGNLKFLNEASNTKKKWKKVTVGVNSILDQDHTKLKRELRRFEYFFSKSFVTSLLEPMEASRYISVTLNGYGKAIKDFGLESSDKYANVRLMAMRGEIYDVGEGGDASYKVPDLYFDIDSEGFIDIFWSTHTTSLFNEPLSKTYFLNLAKKKSGADKKLCQSLATLVGKNVFPDAPVQYRPKKPRALFVIPAKAGIQS